MEDARYAQLAGSGELFDRAYLLEGTTKSGRSVPAGGVRLRNGTLAGYVQQAGGYDKTWTIIGLLNDDHPTTHQIPLYQKEEVGGRKSKGGMKKSTTRKGGAVAHTAPMAYETSGGGDITSKPVSLKSAVKMLRDYYRNNFN